MKIKTLFRSLTKFETSLWLSSVAVIILCSALGGVEPISTAASLIGVTSLIFIAKGNVVGQILTVVFSVFYGIISFGFRYYGEMITYLCMTAPMAALAVFTWPKHPSDAGAHEVEAAKLTKTRAVIMIVFTVIVTGAFWFILGWLGAANLVVSTVSVATSFIASYLTWCRSPYYAIAYAANDIVLIILSDIRRHERHKLSRHDRLLRRLPRERHLRLHKLEPQNGGAGIGTRREKRLNVKNHAVCG